MKELLWRLGLWMFALFLLAVAATPWKENVWGSKYTITHYAWFAWGTNFDRGITPIAFTVGAIGLVLVGTGLGMFIKSFLP